MRDQLSNVAMETDTRSLSTSIWKQLAIWELAIFIVPSTGAMLLLLPGAGILVLNSVVVKSPVLLWLAAPWPLGAAGLVAMWSILLPQVKTSAPWVTSSRWQWVCLGLGVIAVGCVRSSGLASGTFLWLVAAPLVPMVRNVDTHDNSQNLIQLFCCDLKADPPIHLLFGALSSPVLELAHQFSSAGRGTVVLRDRTNGGHEG